MESYYMAHEIPDEYVLNRVRIVTVTGKYEIVVTVDGEWVHVIWGDNWPMTDYEHSFVKLHDENGDYQTGMTQVFRTSDGIEHLVGEFVGIYDYPLRPATETA